MTSSLHITCSFCWESHQEFPDGQTPGRAQQDSKAARPALLSHSGYIQGTTDPLHMLTMNKKCCAFHILCFSNKAALGKLLGQLYLEFSLSCSQLHILLNIHTVLTVIIKFSNSYKNNFRTSYNAIKKQAPPVHKTCHKDYYKYFWSPRVFVCVKS